MIILCMKCWIIDSKNLAITYNLKQRNLWPTYVHTPYVTFKMQPDLNLAITYATHTSVLLPPWE